MGNGNGNLEWNENTDLSLDNINLSCKSRRENKPKKTIVEKEENGESKFYEREVIDITFEDCKPMTKRNLITNKEETIDKSRRLFLKNITIQQSKLGKELSYDDKSLNIETRQTLLKTRLNTLDNRIKDPEFASQRDEYLKSKTKIEEKIKMLETEKEVVQSKRLFEE